jgi:polysaccharide biosynthesis/export protein
MGIGLLATSLSAQNKLPVAPSAEAGSNLPSQPVGANDLITLSVYGAPELSRSLRINPEGMLRVPMVKQALSVRGKMPLEIETLIAQALTDEDILVDPVVTVTLAELASRPVNVAGAVRKPTTFQANGRTTLLDALTRAEGLDENAGQEILVTRSNGETERVSVRALFEKADPAANLALEGGEQVRVPDVGRVFIVGNVLKPGSVPLNDAGGMSVLKALAMAEGLTRFATKEAYIYRPDPTSGEKKEVRVELRKIMDRKEADVTLLAGDIFYVPDNRKGRMTASVIDRIVSFGAGTASGALVYAARP